MSKLNFFTPVHYRQQGLTKKTKRLSQVDRYFFLGGRSATVISNKGPKGAEKVVIVDAKTTTAHKILKILSYLTVIAPISMLIAKAILRSKHTYKVFNTQKQLEKGIHISKETVAKIQKLVPSISKGENHRSIEWIARGNNYVFRLKNHPNLVFKYAPDAIILNKRRLTPEMQINERFRNMVKAKAVCIANNLNLLQIPQAQKIEVMAGENKHLFIVEESLDFPSEESAHEELYASQAANMKETNKQLVTFIAQTGFNDVTWRNVPLINEAPGYLGARRVALIDLELMLNAQKGFTGDKKNESRGFIRCLNPDQIDEVVREARQQGVKLTDKQVKKAKGRRLAELEEIRQIKAFHVAKGIQTGKELLDVDVEALELNLDAKADFQSVLGSIDGKVIMEANSVTMRDVAVEVIKELNKLIQASREHKSVRAKRYFILNINHQPLSKYIALGLPKIVRALTPEDEKKLWLHQIISALVAKGHLYKLEKVNALGYFIQA